jgi:tetratricopeptide (TPR) repeat protein
MENYRKADAIKPNDPGVSFAMARVLRKQERFSESEARFRKVIDEEKSFAEGYTNLYALYMQEKKTEEAEQLIKEAIKNNPKDAQYMELLASHYVAMGRRDDVLDVLQKIKSHAKEWDGVYQSVADFYLRINDTESALREYREAMVKDPKRKTAYEHSIIEVLLHQGKRSEAAEMNSQMLKENPKDNDAKSLAATFLLDQGDVTRALAELQVVVNADPSNAVAHDRLGRAYMASGRADARESARQQFERAIQLRQDYISPRLGLASLQVMHNEFQAALGTAQDILKIDPGNLSARLLESQALVGEKKFGESDTLLAGMAKANPSSPDVFYQAGESALSQGKLQEAKSAFTRSFELNPENPRGLVGIVETDLAAGKPEDAMALLQNEIRNRPARPDIQFLIGYTAERQGRYGEALGAYNRVLGGLNLKAKVRAELYMQIADTYRRQGDRDNTIANLVKAREIAPENETVLSQLGEALDGAGRAHDAREAYEACLKINPNNVGVLNNLAFLLAETNADLDVALNYAQKAKGLAPNDSEIADTYGWVLVKKNLTPQAIGIFKTLTASSPAKASYHYHLAFAYWQGGEAKNAMDEAREALKRSPAKDEQQRIQDLIVKLGGR